MALWTPEYTDTALWLDAADASTLTLDGSAVSEWRDKSGGSNHLSQANAGKKPEYGSFLINGISVVSFDGDKSLLSSSNIGAGVSLFYVQQTEDNFYIVFCENTSSGVATGLIADTTSSTTIYIDFGTPVNFVDGTQQTFSNRQAVRNALNNRVSLVENIGATLTNWNLFEINGYPTSTFWFTGDIAEVVIVAGTPTTDTRQLIE